MVINIHMMYKDSHHDPSWSYVQVLWTLGVEEQFYLFWPLFATKLWKLSMRKGLIAIGIAIFFLYQLYYLNPSILGINFIFYPFWQILVGCFVAYYQ
jgi:peptidoglycan/LPS O-acetylase OafA/YrhL